MVITMRLEDQKGQQGPKVDSHSGMSTKLFAVGLVAFGETLGTGDSHHAFCLVWLGNTEWAENTP